MSNIDPNNEFLTTKKGFAGALQGAILPYPWDDEKPCPNNNDDDDIPDNNDTIEKPINNDINDPLNVAQQAIPVQKKEPGAKTKLCEKKLFEGEFNEQFKSQAVFSKEFLKNPNNIFNNSHYTQCSSKALREIYFTLIGEKYSDSTTKYGLKHKEDLINGIMNQHDNRKINGVIYNKGDKIKGILDLQEDLRNSNIKTTEKKSDDKPKSIIDRLETIADNIETKEKEKEDEYKNTNFDDIVKDDIVKIKDDLPTFKNDDVLYETNFDNYNDYLNALEKKAYKYNEENDDDLEFLYPDLDDPNFSLKIAKRQEFNENKYEQKIVDVKTQSELLCNSDFDLMPHQNFVKNFVSSDTPYNGLLLYHGVGTGKTCSAIGIAEENRKKRMNFNNSDNLQTIIIASPNVQDNFKQQLFDKKKLINNNGLFSLNTCVGNDLIKEVNPNDSIMPEPQLVKQINNIIKTNYNFMGYTQFGLWAKGLISIDNDSGYDKEDIKRIEINRIKKFFNNRLIIIDEVHNLRISDDNSKQKNTTNILMKIAKYSQNMKLILLSATPMYNSYKEIIWMTNLLNINDNRSIIKISDVFDDKGEFIKYDDENQENGDDLLKRKLIGYTSYLRGENPYSFPFRIYPDDFSPDNIYTDKDKPNLQLNNNAIDVSMNLPLYMVSLDTYQENTYNIIIQNLSNYTDESKMPKLENLDAFGYNLLQKPLESLNMVYPKPELDELFSQNITEINKNTLRRYISVSDTDKTIDVVGKSGLQRIMNYETTSIKFDYEYKSDILSRYGRIFSPDNIGKYSSKINSICNNIMKSNGIVIVYSQYIEGGVVPIALSLEERGFTRFSTSNNVKPLFKTPPTEPLDAIHMKPQSKVDKKHFKRARYVLITGDSHFSQSNAEDMKFITNKDNSDGSNVKVIIISKAASEGLDFSNVRQVHILEPWYNLNRIEQIIGRGVRNLSHCKLPFEKRNVSIFLYSFRPIIRGDFKLELADMYVYRLAEKKAKQIGKVTRLLKENSIDCYLNISQTNLSMEKFKELSDNNEVEIILSNNKKINYTIGDRPFSSVCDYMDNCNYSCPSDDKVDEDKLISFTYNDTFVTSNYNAIVKRIKQIFNETPFIKQDELIKQINANKTYPEQQILYVISLFINNQRIVDNIGRRGKIINNGDYYIFQPVEVTDPYASTYERDTNIDYKHTNIIVEKPSGKKYYIEDENTNKSPVKNYETLLKELENIVNDSFNDKLKKGDIAANSDWFKEIKAENIKKYLFEKHKLPENLFKKYVVFHYLDTQKLNIRLIFLTGMYIKDASELNETETYIAAYFENRKMYIENEKFFVMLNNDDNKIDFFTYTYPTFSPVVQEYEKNKFNKIIYSKFVKNIANDKSKMHNVIGFMHPFRTDYMTFKLKDIYTKYNNKGSVCKNLGKEDTIKKLNCLINASKCENNPRPEPERDGDYLYTTKELKDTLRKTGLCIITEFLFRYFDETNQRGLRYFFEPEEANIVNIIQLK